jgi:hypothetical protein
MIRGRPPRNVPECERLARLSAIIFARDHLLDDTRLFGISISGNELYTAADEREKLDLYVKITNNPDGTKHIELDAGGLPLRTVLASQGGDIEMM